MATPANHPALRIWSWENNNLNTADDMLLVGFGHVYGASLVPKNKTKEWRDAALKCTSHDQVLEVFRKARPGLKAVSVQDIVAGEHHPLLTIQYIKLRYRVGAEEKTLDVKPPPLGSKHPTESLFEDLRRLVAPASSVREEQMPMKMAVRGPIISIVLGLIMFGLLVGGSTATERTMSERIFLDKYLWGTLIRKIGPFWWSILGFLWVGGSALLLRSRFKNPPTMKVWRRA